MILKVKTLADVPSSEITPEHVYRSRREFMQTTAAGAVGVVAGSLLGGGTGQLDAAPQHLAAKKSAFTVDPSADPLNTFDQVTSYNNYYEFGTRKDDPMRNAGRLTVKPWTVKVDGLVNKPGDYGVEDLVNFNQLEERVYRLRCVEAWSMVIPWIGVPLSAVLNKVQPQPSAKFVEFTTLVRPSEMPGLRTANLEWPYVEGLRMDEAMHPLTLMVVGLYGKVLPNQNGAPLRVHIPWKYGFKSGKSIVRIRFMANQPSNTWAVQTPHEYGFYANVNPNVDHPRWSQKREKRLPTLFANRQTLMFNGYADQVASLYAGMDLTKYY
jgi:methionine sulfoxide reductase catalytic subunit